MQCERRCPSAAIATDGDAVVIFPGCRGLLHDVPRHVAEYSAASVLMLAGAMAGRPLPVRRIRFRHNAPVAVVEHRRVLGVVPEFSTHETVVVVGAEVLAWPVQGADPGLAGLLERYAGEIMARLVTDEDLVGRIEEQIARRLEHGVPTLNDIARALALTPRTTQRRLREIETTYDEILDSVRRRLAERYVQNDALSLPEVAYLLGFSEPSNFYRAFKRWTGEPPGAWRQKRRAAQLNAP